jgi:Flp pilus assembly protein TadG
MVKSHERNNCRGILSRLLRDQAGNTIAIIAAAVIPVIGLVGGAVDMSRLYLVKTRLQAACDAGSLMGRRTMGTGTWDATASVRAKEAFTANFGAGDYGTTGLTNSYTSDAAGAITGTASVTVPMTLMRVFNKESSTIITSCTAEFRLPATDIMFVLDTTGSMNCPADDTTCGNNGNVEAANGKIKGLRSAIYCFYESISKQNITNVDKSVCGEAKDPSGTNSDIRVRMGFVPYAVNVNVGKLLPLSYIADEWEYQSREARYSGSGSGYTFTYGNEGAPTVSNGAPGPLPDGDWVDRYSNNLAPTQGGFWYGWFYASSATSCNITMPNPIPSSATGDRTLTSQTPETPVHPDATVTRIYQSTDTAFNYTYRYNYVVVNDSDGNPVKLCRMQRKQVNRVGTTKTETVIVPVIWKSNRTFEGWSYKKNVRHNVSGLKDTLNNSWKSSVSLPIGSNGTNVAVNWNGCIEERQTARINDGDPSNDWDTVPASAIDMDIERPPVVTDPDTLWGPMLSGAVYVRAKDSSTNYTANEYNTNASGANSDGYQALTVGEQCPSPARLYEEWDNPDTLYTYVNGLQTGGNTYHDIGLLWGARLMAPQGIFKANTSDVEEDVERHMIFMTDGDTRAFQTDYSAYGVHWWDRRQSNDSNPPSEDWLKSNIDARTQAICRWVRNEDITLWVISYGNGVNAATETALENCATDGRYIKATSPAALVTEFKTIASQISALRLTS